MGDINEVSGLLIKMGLGMSIFFAIAWAITEWGIWHVSEIDMVIFGFILAILGAIGKLASMVEKNTSAINGGVRST